MEEESVWWRDQHTLVRRSQGGYHGSETRFDRGHGSDLAGVMLFYLFSATHAMLLIGHVDVCATRLKL